MSILYKHSLEEPVQTRQRYIQHHWYHSELLLIRSVGRKSINTSSQITNNTAELKVMWKIWVEKALFYSTPTSMTPTCEKSACSVTTSRKQTSQLIPDSFQHQHPRLLHCNHRTVDMIGIGYVLTKQFWNIWGTTEASTTAHTFITYCTGRAASWYHHCTMAVLYSNRPRPAGSFTNDVIIINHLRFSQQTVWFKVGRVGNGTGELRIWEENLVDQFDWWNR